VPARGFTQVPELNKRTRKGKTLTIREKKTENVTRAEKEMEKEHINQARKENRKRSKWGAPRIWRPRAGPRATRGKHGWWWWLVVGGGWDSCDRIRRLRVCCRLRVKG